MKRSFTNQSIPVISGIFAGQTVDELIAEARYAQDEGATGITIDLFDLKPEFRNTESLKSVVDSVHIPTMFYFYRNDKQEQLDDEQRQKLLLAAADAGASCIDVMGDLYDPAPNQITYDANAIQKQKKLIDAIHAKGAEVIMSSHTNCFRTTEQIMKHLQAQKSRGADIMKIVTTADTQEEFLETIKAIMQTKSTLKAPFILICGGKYAFPVRLMGLSLGVAVTFAVSHYEPKYHMNQPTVRAMKAILDNYHWSIDDVL